MPPSSSPTLEDVAKLAGVSTASISRALNEPGKVAEATRKRIEEAIEVLGYTPNFGGRALASKRTNTIGAVIPSMANAMFANGLQAFQEELAKENMTLLVATTGFDPTEERRAVKSLVAQGADALLLIGNARPAETWEFIDKRNVLHLIAWCNHTRDGHLFVGFDNARAAGDAARAAMDMGHRRIGLICGQTHLNDRAKERRDGVIAAVKAFGQGARLTHVVESPYLIDEAGAAFAEIMARPVKPTVVLCANDAQAAGAMMKAREMGIDLPSELSFVGFDDIGVARVVTPALTTIRVPQMEMGQEAARLLIDMMAGKPDLSSQTIPTQLVMRASLVPPLEA